MLLMLLFLYFHCNLSLYQMKGKWYQCNQIPFIVNFGMKSLDFVLHHFQIHCVNNGYQKVIFSFIIDSSISFFKSSSKLSVLVISFCPFVAQNPALSHYVSAPPCLPFAARVGSLIPFWWAGRVEDTMFLI